MGDVEVKEAVRERYAEAALQFLDGDPGSCCGAEAFVSQAPDGPGFGAVLYDALSAEGLPDSATMASLGCGNPTTVASLEAGEVVLDLGSGAGLDVFLSAKRVGPTGRVYGLDMTDEMLELAERNRRDLSADNVEFLKGDIEAIPLANDSVDVIISNCVINLTPDKSRVFSEAHRVLRPGGRFAVTDMVTLRELTEAEKADMVSWSGCIAGALTTEEYESGLAAAGFRDIEVEVISHYGSDVVGAVVRATA